MQNEIQIIDYKKELAKRFASLNYEWLQKYFEVEEIDRQILDFPEEHIIQKQGYIFFARVNEEIVGTVALLRHHDEIYEIAKMGVTPRFQGKGIGQALLQYCIDFSVEKEFKELLIYSARKLKPAIHLYHKFGFKEIEFEAGDYARTDIKMKKEL